jgi:uncharacterized protein
MNRFLKSLLIAGLPLAVFAQAPTEKALHWEISGNGLAKPSYLFGTIHAACPGDVVLSAGMTQRLDSVKQVFLEVDMDDPNLMATMQKGMYMRDGKRFKDLVKADDYEKASVFFKNRSSMDLEQFGNLKPALLVQFLIPSMMGCMPASWEMTLVQAARKRGLAINGLETVEDQMTVFEKIPYQEQAEMMMEMVHDFEKNKEELRKLQTAYREQNITDLQKMIANPSQSLAKYEAVLLNDRNKNWIPVMVKNARQMPTLFAVGAGHLGGESGIIALLRKAGYVVTPLS